MRIFVLLFLSVLSGCASLGFTPEGVCRKSGLSVGSAEYKDCVSRTYRERRAQFWQENGAAVLVGAAVGLAVNGGMAPAPSVVLPEKGAGPGHLKSQGVSQGNRYCTYGTSRGDYILTMRATELCPRTLN